MPEQQKPAPFKGRKFLLLNLQRAAARLLIFWVLTALVLYIGLCPVINTPLLDRLATWPVIENSWSADKEFFGVPCKQMTFPVKAGAKTYQLSGCLYKHPKGKDIVLISHANAGSLSYLKRVPHIAYLLDNEHSVFIYDYEGYGVSEGNATYRCLARDGIAAFDFVEHKLGYAPGQIVLYGMSMGTGVSCEIARVRAPKAIILDSPYTSAEAAAKKSLSISSGLSPSPFPRTAL